MVRKSYGKMRGTRKKMSVNKKLAITKFLQPFKIGERVYVDMYAGSKFPSARFHGLTGRIIGKKGSAYLVEVRNKKALKTIYIKSEHLKR